MPIEIREVVIKAQLEKRSSSDSNTSQLTEEQLHEFKEAIISEVLEKMEEKMWKKFKL